MSPDKQGSKRWGKPEDAALLALIQDGTIDPNRVADNSYTDQFWQREPFNSYSLVRFRDNVKKKCNTYLANDALLGARRE